MEHLITLAFCAAWALMILICTMISKRRERALEEAGPLDWGADPDEIYETFADLCRFFKREGEITYAADVNFMQKKAEAGEVDIDTAALFLDYASQTVKESVRYSDERNATYRNAVDKAFSTAAGRLLKAMDGEE